MAKKIIYSSIILSVAVIIVAAGVFKFVVKRKLNEEMETARSKAVEAEFKSQVSGASTNLFMACDEKEHLYASDFFDRLDKKGEKKPTSLIDRDSFRVISESCGQNGEWGYKVEITGKDKTGNYKATCTAKGCDFN